MQHYRRVSGRRRGRGSHALFSLLLLVLELDDLGHDGLGSLLLGKGGIEVIEVVIIGVHEVDSCGVVDFVAALLRPILVVNPIGLNLELPQTLLQLYVVLSGPSHPNYVLAELREVFLDSFGWISFGINRNEDYLQLHVCAFRQVADDTVDGR